MRTRAAAALLLLAAVAVLSAACENVDLSIWNPESPDNATATAIGPVAGFGSLIVAGAELTDNASTTVVDDRGRGLGDLVAGMTVTVRGTLNPSYAAGSASTVTIEREVRGPVADNGVALDNGTIRVLGQTVVVNPATVVLDSSGNDMELDGLKAFLDDGYRPLLEVHGGVEDNGTIRASYVGWVQDNVAEGDDVDLRGFVKSLDSSTRTFRIGEQVVNYTSLPSEGRVDWPPAGLSNGLTVDVRGYLDNDAGTWVVRADRSTDSIAVITVDVGDLSERVTLEGYVLSGTSESFEMSVPGGTVTVTANAEPEGDAFGLGKKVRVNGTVKGNDGKGVRATSVFVLKALEILLEGAPEDLPEGGDTITLLGKTVETGLYTMFRDPAGGVRDGFGLGSLSAGDIVRVIGWVDGAAATGKIEAARLDRIDGAAGRVGLQGPVASFVEPVSLSILGLTVNTGPAAVDYYDLGGVELANRAEFYGKLTLRGAGTIVRVRNGVFVSASSRIDPPTGGDRMELEIVSVNR